MKRLALRLVSRRRLLVGLLGLIGLALAGTVVLAVIGLSRASLRTPAPTVWVTDRHGRFLGAVSGEADGRLGFWPVERPPLRVEAALLAIEDQAFWRHPGVDAGAVLRAVAQNVRHGRRISGASTLAMQVARMQRPADRTWSAKLTEAATALALVQRYGRRAILDHYLRLAPYGNEVHGIAFAARWYFDKPVADLSWAEVAFLTALPQAPGLMNPYTERGRRRARVRAERILAALVAQGRLSEAEAGEARNSLERLQIRDRPAREPATLHALLALAERPVGESVQPGGPPILRATLDLDLQSRAVARVKGFLGHHAPDGVQTAALVVVDLHDQAVRAAVGSGGYDDTAPGAALDFTRIRRSPGSTLKPFLYGLALQAGVLTATTPQDDLARAQDGIGNADGRFLGPMLPAFALGNSRNVPAVALVERLGVEPVYALYRRLGLHAEVRTGQGHGLGLALGSQPVRLVDLAAAATALARDGRLRPLRWRVDAPEVAGEAIFSPEIARQIAGFLADGSARLPTFPTLARLPFPVALKTGTSTGWRDGWTVAWTRRFLVVAWVGRPDGRPMRRLGGAQVASQLVVPLLGDLHPGASQGLEDLGFPAPEGWRTETVCALSGHRPTPACDRVTTAWRAPDAPPLEPCRVHVQHTVDRHTGEPVPPDAPTAERRTFLDLPGRYTAWMAQNGLRPPPGRPRGEPSLSQGKAPTLRITSPRNGADLLRDPEAPAGLGTLALTVAVDPPGAEVLWSVNGVPFALVGPPYTVRWPLVPGEHRIEARIPYTDVVDRVTLVAR